jgi:tellurite resistance protein TehA-like permease
MPFRPRPYPLPLTTRAAITVLRLLLVGAHLVIYALLIGMVWYPETVRALPDDQLLHGYLWCAAAILFLPTFILTLRGKLARA